MSLIQWIRYFACMVLFSFLTRAYGQGIDFEHLTWVETLAKAKKEHQLIFLDAYTSWCGPCKQMNKRVFTNTEVGRLFNAKFLCIRIDVEKEKALGLDQLYDIAAFPALLFLDQEGKVVHRVCGYRNAQRLIEDANTALDPQKRLLHYQQQFTDGNRAETFLRTYIQKLIGSCTNPANVVEAYWKTQKPKHYTHVFNWMMYLKFVRDIRSKQFIYLLENLDTFRHIYGHDPDAYIVHTYKNALSSLGKSYWKAASEKSQHAKQILERYEKCKQLIRSQKYAESTAIICEFDLIFYDHLGWYQDYAQTATHYVAHGIASPHRADKLNQIAWKYYEHIDNPKDLQNALKWIKISLEIVESYANLDTYAALLFKTGDLQKGQEMALKAIEIAKKKHQEYTATENLMKKYLR